jgi:threonine/homoserine/homoserine lactone efflux protein
MHDLTRVSGRAIGYAMNHLLWAFLGISVLVIVTPGPDTALTVRNTLLGGRAGGIATAFGVASGQGIWATGTSLGVIGLLLASSAAFRIVQWLGAAYLIFLGLQALGAALRGSGKEKLVPAAYARLPRRRAFQQGIISNLGNPKMAVFFASLLPQFVPSADFVGLLGHGFLFCAMTLTWLIAYAVVIAGAHEFLQRSVVKRMLEALTGAALIGLGLRIASEQR